ncbi:hypothetical protein NDN17_14435 [Shewanella algae]|uniref:hypothetical protein n=1 Tax=Shewanella algae TaxID=38313 RepID=UPI0020356B21|nr:hypothetical protein [Shewanella algae]MCM2529699.1 hypothetical protein [Shewanella algae]
MIDAVCTYGGTRKTYNIIVFQKLPDSDIERYRRFLECPNPRCSAEAYYKRASVDGKSACFGSRYHIAGCHEGRSSPQQEREVRHAQEVNKVLADSSTVIFDFLPPPPKKASSTTRTILAKGNTTNFNKTKSYSQKANRTRKPILDMEKALNSLMRGSDLAESDILIEIDKGYSYRAKNLFVHFTNVTPADTLKEARPKMFWGTISHPDAEMDWLNPSDCDDVGIPIQKHKNKILKRFKIREKRDLEGAAVILFGKCFWNAKKTRKIIELWDSNRVFISIFED